MVKKPEQLSFWRRETRVIEKTQSDEITRATHVVSKGATLYLVKRGRDCWTATETAYCIRLTNGGEPGVKLLRSLRIYRDKNYQQLPAGKIIYVARSGLIKVK